MLEELKIKSFNTIKNKLKNYEYLTTFSKCYAILLNLCKRYCFQKF